MSKETEKRVALVLSGGAALGAAHLGVAKVLQENGYQFDFYAGVSAGAIVASLLAIGTSPAEILKQLYEVNFFKLAFDLAKRDSGILRGEKIEKLLEELLGQRRIEELPSPLYLGATDFVNGERVIISRGKLSQAARASISVPALFVPYYHPEEKRWLADGCLTQNLPLDLAIENYSGQTIISVDVASQLDPNFDPAANKIFGKAAGLKSAMERSLRIMFKNQQVGMPKDPRVHKIYADISQFSGFDIHKLKQIVKQGELAANKILSDLN